MQEKRKAERERESNQRRGKGIVRESNEGTNDGSH
jgi:hypothetical protein